MLSVSLKSHESCVVHPQSLPMSPSVHTYTLPDTMLATPLGGVIRYGLECPLVPPLPSLQADCHCYFMVADLAQRETLGTEPSASDPCAGLEWILSRCLLRNEETVIHRDSDPRVGEVRETCSSLLLPQWLQPSRANIRCLAMNHKALCILASTLTPSPAFSALG